MNDEENEVNEENFEFHRTRKTIGNILGRIGAILFTPSFIYLIYCICCLFLDAGSIKTEIVGPVLIIFFAGMLLLAIAHLLLNKICDKCGCSLKGCEYSYRSCKTYNKTFNDELSKKMCDVNIKYICPYCGKKYSENKSFVVYDYKTGVAYNIEGEVEEYCLRKFRH